MTYHEKKYAHVLKEFDGDVRVDIMAICVKHNVIYMNFIGWIANEKVRFEKYKELKQTHEAFKNGERTRIL